MPEPATPYFLTDEEVKTIRLMITAWDIGAVFIPPKERRDALAATFNVTLSEPDE